MVISDCTVGMGITGSFCSFEKTKDVAKRLVDSFTHVTPVYSYNAQMMNTRFGKAGDFMHTISCLLYTSMGDDEDVQGT